MLGLNLTTKDSSVFLAISQTGDATGSWGVYQIYSGLNQGVNGTNLLCDQPKLGYSADKFTVACSDYDDNLTFYGGALIVASKSQGLAGVMMTIGWAGPYANVFGVVPAQNLGAGSPAYMVENLSPAPYTRLWDFTGDPAAGLAGVSFQTTNVPMVATAIPPPAPQPSSTSTIDTGDDRFMSAVVLNGELWTSGTAGCIPPGDVGTFRSCMRVIQIGVSAASLDQSTTAGLVGKYIYYPTLNLSSTGDATIVYSMSSATDYPDLYSTQQPKGNGGSFVGGGPIEVGTQAYTGGRWGDYSAAAADMYNPGKVWVAGEWSTATGSAPGLPSWSTAIARIAAVPSVSPLSTASHQLYALTSSDGATWQPIDNVNLSVTFTPAAASLATISGNADLYTDTIGYNQDIGVMLSGGSFGAGLGSLVGWKESGGFAGTFSPNAAYVQTEQPVQAGTQYTATLVWKTNRSAPGVTIRSGSGPLPGSGLSPARLTAEWVPTGGNNLNSVALNQLFALPGSDGATWRPLAGMTDTFTPSIGTPMAVLSGNADLYTDVAGYNQDIGLMLSGGAYGSGTLVAWKESGGFAGTFSPNAAFVQTVQALVPAIAYTVTLVWKTNKNAPGVTIRSGAGPDPGTHLISPTRLTWQLFGASAADSKMTNALYQLTGSDGTTWKDMDANSNLTLSFTPVTTGSYLLSGNADLYTNTLGYNQDIGIFISGGAYGPSPGTLLGWKESGGFGGTFSPNAAYVETATNLTASTTYTIALRWKDNKPSPSNAIISAGAGPDPGTHLISPTRLTVVLGG